MYTLKCIISIFWENRSKQTKIIDLFIYLCSTFQAVILIVLHMTEYTEKKEYKIYIYICSICKTMKSLKN